MSLSRRWLVPGLIFIGMVVAVVSSLGAPLIPTVASTDHVSLSSAQWMLTIRFLVGAVATPTMGRLADGRDRRATIIVGLMVVATGALLAALPLGFALLLVGCGLQGVGLGLTAMAMSVARDALPPDRVGRAVAMLSITTVAGIGLGYPITGFIAEYGGLHAAFSFGVVFTVLALVVAMVVVPSSSHLPPVRLPIAGVTSLGAALAFLLLALSEGQQWGWTSAPLLASLAGGAAFTVAWVMVESHAAHPLVNFHLLRKVGVVTADVTIFLAGIPIYILISLVTRVVQTPATTGYGLGASVATAGFALLPFSVASAVASYLVSPLVRHTSRLVPLPLGALLALAGTLYFAVDRASIGAICGAMGLVGLGTGTMFAAAPGFIIRAVPAAETGSATSFNQVLRYVGYAAGSALSAVILAAHTAVGSVYPTSSAYLISALGGCGVWVVTAAAGAVLPRIGAHPGGEVAAVKRVEVD
jgi:predicted MFS family arabinose efflux permease